MAPETVSFIGESSNPTTGELTRLDGLVVTADGLATDAQLLSTNFAQEDEGLLLVSDEGGVIPQKDFYGYASGLLAIVDKINDELGSWDVSNSKYFKLPTEFKDDGSGSLYDAAQLELQSGSTFSFGDDDDEINLLVDREHMLQTFSQAAGDGTFEIGRAHV